VIRCNDCGHLREAHEHYRHGTDCSLCPCPQFIPPAVGVWRQLVDWLQERFSRA
jgi:hypothetical protein